MLRRQSRILHDAPYMGHVFRLPDKSDWGVTTIDEWGIQDTRYFLFPEQAFAYWRKFSDDTTLRLKGRRLIPQINTQFLSENERIFLGGMQIKNCKGITKKQYGYLKGLQERNPRNGPATESKYAYRPQ